MLLVGAYGKYGDRGLAYDFFLTGDVSWDKRTSLVPRNVISSEDEFGWSVALSGDRALIGTDDG